MKAYKYKEQLYANHFNRIIDERTNIWSMGALMYRMSMADPH